MLMMNDDTVYCRVIRTWSVQGTIQADLELCNTIQKFS